MAAFLLASAKAIASVWFVKGELFYTRILPICCALRERCKPVNIYAVSRISRIECDRNWGARLYGRSKFYDNGALGFVVFDGAERNLSLANGVEGPASIDVVTRVASAFDLLENDFFERFYSVCWKVEREQIF